MLPFLTLSLHSKQPLLVPASLSNITKTIPRTRHQLGFLHGRGQAFVARGVDNGSPRREYEVDPEKAREALVELDQQLQAISKKQLRQSKIRGMDLSFTRSGSTEEVQGDEVTADIGSPLAVLFAGLFLFTIFYNILFITVIKPSIDLPVTGPDPVPSSTDTASSTVVARGSSEAAVLQLLPVAPQMFNQ